MDNRLIKLIFRILLLASASAFATWDYETIDDPMGRGSEKHASVFTEDRDAAIVVWRDERSGDSGLKLIVQGTLDGDALYDSPLYHITATVRFDQGGLQTAELTAMPKFGLDNGLFNNAGVLISQIQNAKKLCIEVPL